jgi:hypothetical protein
LQIPRPLAERLFVALEGRELYTQEVAVSTAKPQTAPQFLRSASDHEVKHLKALNTLRKLEVCTTEPLLNSTLIE